MNPALDFVNFIASEVAELTPGQNLFEGVASEEVSPNSVFIRSLGGPEPQRRVDSSNEIRTVAISAMIRNTSLVAAIDLARKVLNATNGTRAPAGYLDARTLQGEPTDAGRDDAGRFRRVVGFQLRFQTDTP